MRKFLLLGICVSFLLPAIAQAQQVRSSYFMEGSNYRMSLNPSFQPTKGFVNLPGIGGTSTELSTNSVGMHDLFEVFASDDDYYNSDKFYNSLKNMNEANIHASTNILSMGAYKGKGFWTFNIGTRVDAEGNIPKSMFDYLRAGDPNYWDTNFDIRDEKLRVNAYIEIGGGYSRAINERLTVGGRAKLLLGAGNIGLTINNLSLSKNNMGNGFQIISDAYLESSVKGVELEETGEYVTDLEYNKFGVSGYGAGFDLGANYKLTDKLTLSASLLDLGFIAWSKSGTQIAESDKNTTLTPGSDYSMDADNVIDFELYGLQKKENKARTTSLSPTLVLGGEYAFFNNELSVGLLSTTRFGKLHNHSELTLSANYRPNTFINASLTYSMLQGGDTFGFVIRIGQLMLGTDYMYLGKNSNHANAFVGLSIPLGKKKE
ncbi:DUF5723 family protein [uncultured Bacteroides sp.]|uniref:DUF5723 family protein n=1 Tax=uncultured Bacteroides sp. TaxID=162156 RepID=UPI00263042E3|nr:DUF5723 family protein [uncultured Bacteroides sp.]